MKPSQLKWPALAALAFLTACSDSTEASGPEDAAAAARHARIQALDAAADRAGVPTGQETSAELHGWAEGADSPGVSGGTCLELPLAGVEAHCVTRTSGTDPVLYEYSVWVEVRGWLDLQAYVPKGPVQAAYDREGDDIVLVAGTGEARTELLRIGPGVVNDPFSRR